VKALKTFKYLNIISNASAASIQRVVSTENNH